MPGCHFSTLLNALGPGPTICRDLEVPADAFEIIEPEPKLLSPFPDGDHILWWGDAKSAASLAKYRQSEVDGFFAYQELMQRGKEIAQEFFLSHHPPTHKELYDRYPRDAPPADAGGDVDSQPLGRPGRLFCERENQVRSLARADDCGYPTAVGSLLAEVVAPWRFQRAVMPMPAMYCAASRFLKTPTA